MPLISVIIPVYNTEKYIQRCLESVCNQTLSDIEIICINDCSTDKSLEKILDFSKKDPRVKVVDFKKNIGASSARNIGIDTAKGDYISFVDSDDFLELDFYEKLYKKAIETNSDIIKGCYRYYENNYINPLLNQKIKENKFNFAYEYCSAIFKNKFLKNNSIKFPELRDMEDPVFAFKSALKSNKIVIVDDALINIFKRTDSQTAKKPTIQILKDKIYGLTEIVNIANSYNKKDNRINFVPALWFKICADNISRVEFNEQVIFVQNLYSVYEKISNKEAFLYYLKYLSEILYKNLITNNLIFYLKDEEIYKLKNELKELKSANKKLDEYSTFLINEYVKENKNNEEEIYFISVVNNYDLYNKCVAQNPFVKNFGNIKCIDFDNTKENIYIPKRYNTFLNNYDYSKNSWFIFCHCDWELLEDINKVIKKLDKHSLYGPVGSRVQIVNNKAFNVLTGFCFEKRRDGSGLRGLGNINGEKQLSDTFDCQALIVHSSLIKKYNLRFDENLKWDLYIEDFCINSKKTHGILSYSLKFLSCHWSGYHNIPPSYYESLEYVNKKYPNDIYSGTVSLIGGKKLEKANFRDLIKELRKK